MAKWMCLVFNLIVLSNQQCGVFRNILSSFFHPKMKGLISSECLGEYKYANVLIGNGASVWCKTEINFIDI